MKRIRVTLSFVLAAKEFPVMGPLLDGFEGAVRGLWRGMECDIEPDGRLKVQQLKVPKGAQFVPGTGTDANLVDKANRIGAILMKWLSPEEIVDLRDLLGDYYSDELLCQALRELVAKEKTRAGGDHG